MRVLITGSGMIGCHTAARLTEMGHFAALFDHDPHPSYIRSVAGEAIHVYRGDITQIGELTSIFLKEKIDAVVHTAARIGGIAQESPFLGLRTNLGGTLAVAEAARVAGVSRIVYAGTHGVYALDRIREAPFTEAAPTAATSVYAASKLSSEHVLEAYGAAYAMEVVSLRFCNVFGRGEFSGGSGGGIAFQEMVTGAVRGTSARVGSALQGHGEWIYVKDAAEAISLALTREVKRPGFAVINIGSGVLHDEEDLMEAVRHFLPSAHFELDPPGERRSTVRHQPFILAAAQSLLGFAPRYDLKTAMGEYIDELRAADPPFPLVND